MPQDRETLVRQAVSQTAAAAKPAPADDGTEAALRIVFDPGASIEAKTRAFRLAVRMVTHHASEEDASEGE